MASLEDVTEAAINAGFKKTTCVHEDKDQHLVYDFPGVLGNSTVGYFCRVHINLSKKPTVTYIVGSKTPQQRVSFKNAIDFINRAREGR